MRFKFNKKIEFFLKSKFLPQSYLFKKRIERSIKNNYEVCLSSESTTAAIEFWEKDKKVITYVSGINFSPLLGCQNVSFVYNKKDLYKSVLSNLKTSKPNSANNYFILNKKIPIWAEIIKKNLK